jgi:pantoate--beta-alanine ligase
MIQGRKLTDFTQKNKQLMILLKKAADLRKYLDIQRKIGMATGFVPTMGALHQGHISLIEQARLHNPLVICSIFVNPAQFNDPADYKKYPSTIDRDIAFLENAGCDVLFYPPMEEVYPEPDEKLHYDLGYLESIMEGKYRPGHFQGVCKVVHRLLQLVRPDNLYIGQKDYQQCLVIKHLIGLTGMTDVISLHISPTLREKDGLAMSSRNTRLDEHQRQIAPGIFQTLNLVKKEIKPGNLQLFKQQAMKQLHEKGFRPDYVEIADAATLQPINDWDGRQKLVVLAAAFLGEVRLIDNLLIN